MLDTLISYDGDPLLLFDTETNILYSLCSYGRDNADGIYRYWAYDFSADPELVDKVFSDEVDLHDLHVSGRIPAKCMRLKDGIGDFRALLEDENGFHIPDIPPKGGKLFKLLGYHR